MSIQKIDELKDGDRIDSNFMVLKIEKKNTKNGKTYKAVQLRNASGVIGMNVWDNKFEFLLGVGIKDIVHVIGTKDDYGIKLYSMERVDPTSITMSDYYDIAEPADSAAPIRSSLL